MKALLKKAMKDQDHQAALAAQASVSPTPPDPGEASDLAGRQQDQDLPQLRGCRILLV